MNDIIKKLTSRKFWAAIAGVVTGLSIAFCLDENVISSVSGAVVTVMSVVTYIVTEGKVDAAAVGQAVKDVQEAANTIDGTEGAE